MTLGVVLSLQKKGNGQEQSQEHAWKGLVSNLDQADGPGWWHERADDWKEDVCRAKGSSQVVFVAHCLSIIGSRSAWRPRP